MKKVLILAVALFGLMLFTQCSKTSKCKCEEYDATDNYYYGSTIMDPESWGATNCSDLEIKLRMQALQSGYDEYFKCHKE
jgi:hypothetical protein